MSYFSDINSLNDFNLHLRLGLTMRINKFVHRINEFTDAPLRIHNEQCKYLKKTLRQLRVKSKELEQEIQIETRKGNKKILHEKHKIVTMQRKKGLAQLQCLRKENYNSP